MKKIKTMTWVKILLIVVFIGAIIFQLWKWEAFTDPLPPPPSETHPHLFE